MNWTPNWLQIVTYIVYGSSFVYVLVAYIENLYIEKSENATQEEDSADGAKKKQALEEGTGRRGGDARSTLGGAGGMLAAKRISGCEDLNVARFRYG